MVLTAKSSLIVPPLRRASGPSKTRSSTLELSFSALTDIAVFTVVVGRSDGEPATYADLDGVSVITPLIADRLAFESYDSGSFYRGRLTAAIAALSALDVGDQIWVCLFEDASLSGGDVPAVVFGPLLLIA